MRSKLFVPASRPELFAKAEASAADSLSFDLEDSVREARKDEARQTLADYLKNRIPNEKAVLVRINGVHTSHFEADVEAMVGAGVETLNLPMPNRIEDVSSLEKRIAPCETKPGSVGILVNIETPAALRHAAELAAHPRAVGLQLGYADLLEPYGIDRRDEFALAQIRLTVRLAAAEANIPAYDGAFAGIKEMEFFERECLAARRHGFSGKSCIHPSQIAIANQAFMPSEAELERARKIVAAAAQAGGAGAFVVDGQMIDKPFLARAQALLALCK